MRRTLFSDRKIGKSESARALGHPGKQGPNGDVGVDAMMSTMAHEIVEAVSDPYPDSDTERAWEDGSHQENGAHGNSGR